MRRLLPFLTAGALLAVLPSVAAADATVSIPPNDVKFLPDAVSIQAGQKVTWDFATANFGHDVLILAKDAPFPPAKPATAPDFVFSPGGTASFQHQFPTAGTFRYVCTLHFPAMKGTVTVTDQPPPPPPPPPAVLPPEPVAFGRLDAASGAFDLFSVTATEASPKRLTQAAGDDFDPAWSYDGARRELAFQSGRNGRFDIFTAGADGTGAVDVTPGTPDTNEVEPAWSPDSSKIAFSSDRTGAGDLYVMDFDGGNLRRLTSDPAPDRHPTWSPDGKRIAFASTRTGASAIWIMDVDPAGTGEGTNPRQMNPDFPLAQSEPVWSPVDDRIAYVQLRGSVPDPDPVVFDLVKDTVSAFLTGNGAKDESPTWSPDAKRIIWTRTAPGGEADLVIRPSDGTGIEQVITALGDGAGYTTPAWQPAARPASPRPAKPAPPAGGGAETEDTRPDPGTAPAAAAFLGLDAPHRTTLKAFRKLGLPVVARCTGVEKGTARLLVSRKAARKLRLPTTTLAAGKLACGPDRRASVLLKPGKRVARALKRTKLLKATLTVTFSGAAAKLTDKLAIRIAR